MESSAMEFQLWVFGFLPLTRSETNANKMLLRSLRTLRHFAHVCRHAQTTVHMHLINHGYYDGGINPDTPN